ncbi:MAG TPA: c-type cytochrome [Bryobacteraceae bacterium]|jgi:putative heme-binding domain-containing protein
MRVSQAIMLVAAAGLASAQHTFTPNDIEDGGQLFKGTCVGCHGPDGNLVPGIDLAHGKLRHASNDDQMAAIIRAGIPGTAMPPNNFTEFQAETIVAYLHSIGNAAGAATTGDVARGKTIFESKGGCANCHRIRGQGSRRGPDLSDIGAYRRAPELEKSILDPDAEILPQNRSVRLVTKDGATVTGRLLNEDTFNVMVLDASERLKAYAKSDLKEFAFVDKSPMPSSKGKLSAQEVADVVAYLSSLKGVEVK